MSFGNMFFPAVYLVKPEASKRARAEFSVRLTSLLFLEFTVDEFSSLFVLNSRDILKLLEVFCSLRETADDVLNFLVKILVLLIVSQRL